MEKEIKVGLIFWGLADMGGWLLVGMATVADSASKNENDCIKKQLLSPNMLSGWDLI